jgi:hypothetical protein
MKGKWLNKKDLQLKRKTGLLLRKLQKLRNSIKLRLKKLKKDA